MPCCQLFARGMPENTSRGTPLSGQANQSDPNPDKFKAYLPNKANKWAIKVWALHVVSTFLYD